MGTLAFVCAMPLEMRPLAKRLDLEKRNVAGVELRAGTLDGQPVVGFVTGMGTRLAEERIDRLLAAVHPERVIVFGIAGAVDDEMPIGAVVSPARVIDHGTGRTHEHHPPGGEATSGALWTTDIMTPREDLPGLIEKGVVALDMETAAIAQSCERDGVPWSVHRAISDHPKDEIDDEVFKLGNQDGTMNWANIARYFLKHPQRIPAMLRLGKGNRLATGNAAGAAIAAARAAR